jgi:hypothetical protein
MEMGKDLPRSASQSNLGDTHFPEAVGNSLLDHLLAAPQKDWNALLIELDKKGKATDGGPAQEARRPTA